MRRADDTGWVQLFLLGVFLVCMSAAPAHGHSRALGRAVLQLDAAGAGDLQIILTQEDVEEFFAVDLRVPEDHQRLMTLSQQRFPNFIRILADGERCRLQTPDAMPAPNPRMVFVLPLQCPHVPEILQVDWGLSGIATFDLQVALTLQGPQGPPQQAALARSLTRARFRLRSPDRWQTVKTYWRLGWEHIGEGWDHLAFLLALLLQVATLRQLLLWVTTFTLAHAVTLSLSLWSWLQLPSTFVEPAIAITIVLAALHALWLPHSPKELIANSARVGTKPTSGHGGFHRRVVLGIFGVGLIHGLGFSTLLKETLREDLLLGHSLLQKPDPLDVDLLISLGGFHVGIECGQFLWIALLYPVLSYVRRWPLGIRTCQLLLVGIAALGLWFFLQAST